MIALLCISLPIAVAAALPWVPGARWVWVGAALVELLLAGSLPWTGGRLGGWFSPDPLAVHVVILAAFAWVMAAATGAAPTAVAVLVGLLNLAMLSDGTGLVAIAAGGAGIAAVMGLPPAARGPLLAASAAGTGLAVLGTIVLYVAFVPVLGPGWAAATWSALPGAASRADGGALSMGFVLVLLGLGVSCVLLPIWGAVRGGVLPVGVAMLAGPLGGVWLAVALRLRGILDANGHAVAPGLFLLVTGMAGLVLAALCLRHPDRLLPGGTAAMLAAVLVGFGVGGAAATGDALLHLTLGCVVLTAAATSNRLGLAALVGLPPLGVFASGFALLTDTAVRSGAVAALLGLGLFAVAALGLRGLPESPSGRLGWVGVGLALVGAWAMPPGVTVWIQGIAAAAR